MVKAVHWSYSSWPYLRETLKHMLIIGTDLYDSNKKNMGGIG